MQTWNTGTSELIPKRNCLKFLTLHLPFCLFSHKNTLNWHPQYFGVYFSWWKHLMHSKMVHSNTKNANRVCQSCQCQCWHLIIQKREFSLPTNKCHFGPLLVTLVEGWTYIQSQFWWWTYIQSHIKSVNTHPIPLLKVWTYIPSNFRKCVHPILLWKVCTSNPTLESAHIHPI